MSSCTEATFTLTGIDGQQLCAYSWLPEGTPRAAVMIAHGMAEHVLRYRRFAAALTGGGYAVYGLDLRGHGQTGAQHGALGHFADEGGFSLVVSDLGVLRDEVSRRHPGVAVSLFAHSMGSMFGQDYIVREGRHLAGVVMSGAPAGHGPKSRAGEAFAKVERARVGRQQVSELLHRTAMADPGKKFRPGRTDCDWLSRDEAEVDAYVADPLCGFALTTQSWVDVMLGLQRVEALDYQAAIPRGLPIYLVAGTADPIAREGAATHWLENRLKEVGLTDVTVQLYPDGRHEMLNEVNRELVHADLLSFFDRVSA